MKITVYNKQGKEVGDLELNDSVFGQQEMKESLIHQVVVAQLANRRQGTKSALTRSEVSGGGKKPWRQKGTGNARQGSIRNPQWVGGGIVFGPKPNRNYTKKVNAKVSHLAFKSVITEKVNNDNMYILEDASMVKPNTKTVANLLKKLEVYGKKILFVIDTKSNIFIKSSRNIDKVVVKKFNQVSTIDVMNSNIVVIENKACDELGKVYC